MITDAFCVNDIDNTITSNYRRQIEQGISGSGIDSQILRFNVNIEEEPDEKCKDGKAEVLLKKDEAKVNDIFNKIYEGRKFKEKINEINGLLTSIKEEYEKLFEEQKKLDQKEKKKIKKN